ncbi:hypothetical protein [Sphingomonas sp. PAMC 26621]|uniref:hypothetical protein n=1 Tax=Sphingomonas sp. PAMC 26621 TaxID=1112213 RepID=UPI000287C56D|nr:hypothetical protein [Sphingomonas sp. PAMC 26621]
MTTLRARVPHRWRGAFPALFASIACICVAIGAARLAGDEALAVVITEAVQARSPTARDAALEAYGDRAAATLPPRALAPLAQLAINAAHSAASPELRSLNGARADAMVGWLRRTRPDWGATWLLVAQQERLHHAGATSTAVAAVARSYRLRPFCAACAAWRIAFARLYWPALDAATRTAAIEEAVWQTRYDNGRRSGYEHLLGNSPAGVAYQLRMSGVGQGDANVVSR